MQLLIVRHAIAEDRLAYASSAEHDDLRPITDSGRRRMQAAAEGLRKIVSKIDVLATSPLTRAVQTAEIISAAYGNIDVIQVPALAPGIGPLELARWLSTQADDGTLAIVGHEPDFSQLIDWLSSGREGHGVQLKKGAACLMNCPAEIGAGACQIQWLLPPKLLQMLRD
jgi:phosphohistidine phosphatase